MPKNQKNNLLENLKKTELFPKSITSFLIQAAENKQLPNSAIDELLVMLAEEKEAITKLDEKRQKMLNDL